MPRARSVTSTEGGRRSGRERSHACPGRTDEAVPESAGPEAAPQAQQREAGTTDAHHLEKTSSRLLRVQPFVTSPITHLGSAVIGSRYLSLSGS